MHSDLFLRLEVTLTCINRYQAACTFSPLLMNMADPPLHFHLASAGATLAAPLFIQCWDRDIDVVLERPLLHELLRSPDAYLFALNVLEFLKPHIGSCLWGETCSPC